MSKARTVSQINQQIIIDMTANLAASGITIDSNQWSKRNILRNIIYTIAICIAVLEQLKDAWQTEIEEVVDRSVGGTKLWIQKKMLEFQYSSTNPQYLQVTSDYLIGYSVVDNTLKIITACNVNTDLSNVVKVKTATGTPFAALSSLQIAAAQAYIELLGTAGIQYIVSSDSPDKLFLEGNIYFKGEFSAVIADNTIAALTTYLNNLSSVDLVGLVKLIDIENAIKSAEGVTDVFLRHVAVRPDSVSFASKSFMVNDYTAMSRQYNPIAGYTIEENTVGQTFADKLTFITE